MKRILKFFIFCFTLLLGTTLSLSAQDASSRVVIGKVIDESKEAIIGASVIIKGANTGVITDLEGNYSINIKDNSTLIFSYLGYKKTEINVGSKNVVNITLQEDNAMLDEVVVVGYGLMKKSDVTGAISSLRPDEKDASTVLSVDNLLQGKMAGVSVSNSTTTPGAASSVLIRGANSLRGDNQPLYVIDNIPQASTGEFAASAFGGGDFQIAQNPLTSLNPQDIEDIQVLKDASATAIYGSRGANGVILITTKKGKSGKVRINANANFTISTATDLHKMLNLDEYADFRNDRSLAAAKQFFKEGSEVRYIYSGGSYDPNDPASYHVLQYRDWQNEVYGTAFSQNYAVTLNGGSDKTKYYVSVSFKDVNGLVKSTGLQQGDLRTNLSMDLSNTVKMNMSLSGSIKKNDMMSGGDTKGGATGSITRTAIDSAPYVIPEGEPNLSAEEKTTVWSWIDDYDDITNEKTFRASTDLTWTISKNFSYNVRAGGNIFMQDRARWFGLQLFRGQNDNGSLGITNLERNNFTIENLVNYKTKLGSFADLTALAGVTYDDYNSLNKITAARDFESHTFRTKGLHMARVVNEQQPIQKDYQLLSYLGRANLSMLDGRYLATVNFRADGSSKFNKNNRWIYFPSLALAWRMEQENFIKDNVQWIDQFKLRFGYGQTGNQSIDPYNSFYTYTTGADYSDPSGNKELGLGVSNLQNANLKWEKTSSYNIGLDFSIFRNRLSGAIDVYHKETTDLLISRALGPSTGFPSMIINQGALSNEGIEFSLNGDIIRSKDFNWSMSANISFNTAKIKKLGLASTKYGNNTYSAYLGNSIGDHFGVANIFIEGKAPGLFWGYKTSGIIQEGQTVEPSKISTTTAGNIKFVDRDGSGTIDENDKVILGDPNPDFIYGFQTTFSYKKIALSTSFNGVQGNQIMNGNNRYENMPSRQVGNMTQKAYHNAWTPENQSNTYSSVSSNVPNQAVMDRYIEDGSFLRCSDITISYSFPKTCIRKFGFESIDLFGSIKNAFIITNYKGYDPEVNTFAFDGLRRGIDLNSFPQARSFILGLNMTF